jgi:hypothetical protein
MIDYKLVKYCRLCNVRFVVERGMARTIYCTKCQKKVLAERGKTKES